MKLTELVQEILITGVLPRAAERRIYQLLKSQEISDPEIAAIDQLIEALCNGTIRAIA